MTRRLLIAALAAVGVVLLAARPADAGFVVICGGDQCGSPEPEDAILREATLGPDLSMFVVSDPTTGGRTILFPAAGGLSGGDFGFTIVPDAVGTFDPAFLAGFGMMVGGTLPDAGAAEFSAIYTAVEAVEPSAMALLTFALAALGYCRRRLR